MGKIFPMRTRRLKSQRPMVFQPDALLSDRIAEGQREAERIEADRARRVAERRAAAIALQAQRAREASDLPPPDDWSACDAAWFVSHPDRRHRVRRAVEGEFPPSTYQAQWIAIRQIKPGIRVRLPFDVRYGQRRAFEWAATEGGAALLFEMAARDLGAESLLAGFEDATGHPSPGDA